MSDACAVFGRIWDNAAGAEENIHRVVIFRKSGSAPSVLSLSDRGGANDPEVLLVDAPAVTPYFSLETQQKSR